MHTGLQCLLRTPKRWLGGARVALVANPSSVDDRLRHVVDLLHADPDVNLCLLFGPEHGIRGEAQYMVDVGDTVDLATGLSEVSLYGTSFESLSPTAEDLAGIDALVFDVQDVGARYYTYAATMAQCMRAAGAHGVKVVVLDRPNPIGGLQIEGGGLDAGLENFCGLFPVPQRHGLTVGELARLYRDTFGIECELEVVPCEGWRRAAYFDELDLPWVMPSPNMPTIDTAIVYPGMCLLEGTNISEGRGTTRPFELFGAPYVVGPALAGELGKIDLPGAIFRPCVFQPTFDKYAGRRCGGLQVHVTNRRAFCSYRTGIAVLVAVKTLWPDDFAWRTEPYEFRGDVPAIDLLTGSASVREAIDAQAGFEEVMLIATRGADLYRDGRARALLYD